MNVFNNPYARSLAARRFSASGVWSELGGVDVVVAVRVSGSDEEGLLEGVESWRVIEFVVVCLLRTGEWVEGIEVGEEPMDVTLVSGAGDGFETEVLREGVEEM